MTVFTTGLDGSPCAAARPAALGSTGGGDEYAPLLTPVVSGT
jgi:hypothetical protein